VYRDNGRRLAGVSVSRRAVSSITARLMVRESSAKTIGWRGPIYRARVTRRAAGAANDYSSSTRTARTFTL